jgi:hypothetical protein
MYVDSLLQLSGSVSGSTWTPQTATGTDTSVLSTNTVDLGVAQDKGEGQTLYGRFECQTSASGGTSVEFQIIAADAANLTGNVAVVGTTGPIAVASVTAGKRFACAINARLALQGQRYLGGRFVFVGAVAAGAYVADIGVEVADVKAYASGFAII